MVNHVVLYLSLKEKNKVDLETLKYPVGKYHFAGGDTSNLIATIEELPGKLKRQ